MSSDFVFWLALAVKLVLTAGIVVTASFVTERAGPLIGALVVTCPSPYGLPTCSLLWITTRVSSLKASWADLR